MHVIPKEMCRIPEEMCRIPDDVLFTEIYGRADPRSRMALRMTCRLGASRVSHDRYGLWRRNYELFAEAYSVSFEISSEVSWEFLDSIISPAGSRWPYPRVTAYTKWFSAKTTLERVQSRLRVFAACLRGRPTADSCTLPATCMLAGLPVHTEGQPPDFDFDLDLPAILGSPEIIRDIFRHSVHYVKTIYLTVAHIPEINHALLQSRENIHALWEGICAADNVEMCKAAYESSNLAHVNWALIPLAYLYAPRISEYLMSEHPRAVSAFLNTMRFSGSTVIKNFWRFLEPAHLMRIIVLRRGVSPKLFEVFSPRYILEALMRYPRDAFHIAARECLARMGYTPRVFEEYGNVGVPYDAYFLKSIEKKRPPLASACAITDYLRGRGTRADLLGVPLERISRKQRRKLIKACYISGDSELLEKVLGRRKKHNRAALIHLLPAGSGM